MTFPPKEYVHTFSRIGKRFISFHLFSDFGSASSSASFLSHFFFVLFGFFYRQSLHSIDSHYIALHCTALSGSSGAAARVRAKPSVSAPPPTGTVFVEYLLLVVYLWLINGFCMLEESTRNKSDKLTLQIS